MQVTFGINAVSAKGSKNNLDFINNIRDRNVDYFKQLQKEKVEILLKLREACAVIAKYKAMIEDFSKTPELNSYKMQATSDMSEIENYANTLRNKLHELNLKLIAEEEKNY